MTTESRIPHVLLRSEQTAAQVSVIESAAPPGFTGPPLHHHDFDETFYVLEGELTVQLRDEVFCVRTGQLAFAPRGVPHTFTNLGADRACYLIVCTRPDSSVTSRACRPSAEASTRPTGRCSRSPRSLASGPASATSSTGPAIGRGSSELAA